MGVDEANVHVMDVETITENCPKTSRSYGEEMKKTCVIIIRLAKSGSTNLYSVHVWLLVDHHIQQWIRIQPLQLWWSAVQS